MAHTYCANEFNSTPFTSCCGTAAIGLDKCPRCGEEITHHVDSPAVRRAKELRGQGLCGLCGKPIKDCYC